MDSRHRASEIQLKLRQMNAEQNDVAKHQQHEQEQQRIVQRERQASVSAIDTKRKGDEQRDTDDKDKDKADMKRDMIVDIEDNLVGGENEEEDEDPKVLGDARIMNILGEELMQQEYGRPTCRILRLYAHASCKISE